MPLLPAVLQPINLILRIMMMMRIMMMLLMMMTVSCQITLKNTARALVMRPAWRASSTWHRTPSLHMSLPPTHARLLSIRQSFPRSQR